MRVRFKYFNLLRMFYFVMLLIAGAGLSFADPPDRLIIDPHRPVPCTHAEGWAEHFKFMLSPEYRKNTERAWEDSGQLFHWKTKLPTDLGYLKSLHLKMESDPLTSKVMRINIEDAEKKIIETHEFPWDPELHQREIYFQSIKLREPVLIEGTAIENMKDLKAKADLLSRRRSTSLAEPTLIHKLLTAEKTMTQKTWYILERENEIHAVLAGQKPLDSLYAFFKSSHFDSEVFSSSHELQSISYVRHHLVDVVWIKTATGNLHSSDLDLALNSMIFQLKHYREEITGNLHHRPFALSVHIENARRPVNFHFLDLKEMKAKHVLGSGVDPQWLNAQDDLHRFITQAYANEIGLAPETIAELHQFTAENADRLHLFFLSDEAFSPGILIKKESLLYPHFGPKEETVFKQTGMIKHFTPKASFGVVYSDNPITQPLSLEKYGKIVLDRKPGEKVAELIRLAVDPSERDFSAKFMYKVGAYLANAEKVSRVFCITDERYAKQLVADLGFKKIQVRHTDLGHDEWVLQITPRDFFEHSLAHPPEK